MDKKAEAAGKYSSIRGLYGREQGSSISTPNLLVSQF